MSVTDKIADAVIEKMKERLIESLEVTWELLKESLLDFGYIAALFGGGGLIMVRMCGIKKATPYFMLVQVVNIFIQGLLGGL
ncbi:hypothetical protein ACQKMN_17070 [Ureibacillus composti]